MKALIGSLLAAAAVTFGLAWLPVLADTPGTAPACVSPSINPHPTAPVGPTTDTLFCTSPSTNGTGSTGSSGSTGTSSHGTTQTAGYNAGTGTSNGAATTGVGTTGGGGQTLTTSGAGAASRANSARSTPAAGGFFAGLVAFLGAAGGLAFLFGFLLLLAIALFIVAVVLWLTRRGGVSLGSRFARIAHRP